LLTIRHEQMAALGKAAEARFRIHCVEYLHKILPDICAAMTPEHVVQSVDHAMAMCKFYGFTREIDVLRYLNLMYVFGFGFDRDPGLPWARRILNDRSHSPKSRFDWLCSHAVYEAGRPGGRR
jgi:hypothetical protein